MGCGSAKAVVADAPPQLAFSDKYTLAGLLGKGAYGSVHLAHSAESNEEFAVKILHLYGGKRTAYRPARGQLRTDVEAEQRAFARIGVHPQVVGLREILFDDRAAYFVMERCVSSLGEAWEAEPNLNEYTYARYFREMAQALAHIHAAGVVHRDVKHDNFLLGSPDGRTVKVCDFGLSAKILDERALSGRYGTAPYLAPEMAASLEHGPPADVWSLGVIVYMAFFGTWPYLPRGNTASGMRRAIRLATVPPSFAPAWRYLPRNVVSGVGIRFAKALLERKPLARPSAALCLEMDYLSIHRRQPPSPNETNAIDISLAPLLAAATRCGALRMMLPRAEARRETELMGLQSTAQPNREEGLLDRTENAGRSSTGTSRALGSASSTSQPAAPGMQRS